MTFLPDMSPGYEPEPYEVPRGTCPRCGSGEVRHHVIGFPSDPTGMPIETSPDWVEWEGCIHPGFTRSCTACDLTWLDEEL